MGDGVGGEGGEGVCVSLCWEVVGVGMGSILRGRGKLRLEEEEEDDDNNDGDDGAGSGFLKCEYEYGEELLAPTMPWCWRL